MKKYMLRATFFIVGLILGALVSMGLRFKPTEEVTEDVKEEIVTPVSIEVIEVVREVPVEVVEPETVEEPEEVRFNEEELLFLAKCVEAEAGNQDIIGKRLVVDVILNRIDSDKFPDDIVSVIIDGFSVYPYAMDKAEPSESTWEAIALELETRIDTRIICFRTDYYHSWCEPAFKHGAHYFGY